MASVFLSHSSHDKSFVRRLADGLKAYEVKVWLDEVELAIGQPLVTRLREAIETADHLVVVLSLHAVASHWVREEMQIAYALERELGRSIVRPVLIEDLDDRTLDELFGDRLYADFRRAADFEIALVALLRSIAEISSFADLIEKIDDVPSSRPHTGPALDEGRERVRELSYYYRELEVPHYREWLLWELLRAHFTDGYPMTAVLGVRDGRELSCRLRDAWLGGELRLTLPLEQARRGLWECEQVDLLGNLAPVDPDEPLVGAETFATHFGLPDDPARAPNPIPADRPERLRAIRDEVLGSLRAVAPETVSSLLYDLNHVALGAYGRPVRVYAGFVGYPPEARAEATFCAFDGTPRAPECDRTGSGILYVQIDDEFFKTTNAFFLCPRHRDRLWTARVNLFESRANHPLSSSDGSIPGPV
jgi:hypothetical protein